MITLLLGELESTLKEEVDFVNKMKNLPERRVPGRHMRCKNWEKYSRDKIY